MFNLMTLPNDTRHIKWHKSCKGICRFDKIDKSRCECKDLVDKGVCDKGFIWNPSNCECECDKSCNIFEHLDYSNCQCRKKLVDPLVEECTKNIYETKLVNITVKTENKDKCHSYVVCKMLFFMFFVIIIVIGVYFVYHKYVTRIK